MKILHEMSAKLVHVARRSIKYVEDITRKMGW